MMIDAGVYDLKVGYASLGTKAVGAGANTSLSVQFNAAETPKNIAVTSTNSAFQIGGGTCTAGNSYSAGDSCTVNIAFTPVGPGVSASALTIDDSNGAPLAQGYLSGFGTGAGLTADPGTLWAIGSGYTSPDGAAVDAAGNLFIADAGANSIFELAAGSSTPVALGAGLNAPQGVAVDGAGNVFIADTGNNRIVEIPVVDGAPATSAQTVVVAADATLAGAALNAPAEVALDGSGGLYIADSGNKRVVYIPYNNTWNTSRALTLGSGMSSPSAIALDSAGTTDTSGQYTEIYLNFSDFRIRITRAIYNRRQYDFWADIGSRSDPAAFFRIDFAIHALKRLHTSS